MAGHLYSHEDRLGCFQRPGNLKMNEFSPVEQFYRLVRTWWLIVAAALLGGSAGYLFHRLNPPVYDAIATFYVTIDSTKMPDLPILQYQYDEDLALSMAQAALIDTNVQTSVLDQAMKKNIHLELADLQQNSRIERRHAFWLLHYWNPNPAVAQTVVNLWAKQGYQLMKFWQENKTLLGYIVFAPPSLAALPPNPMLYHQNQVMLAGAVIGLIAGIILVEIWVRLSTLPRKRYIL